LQLVIDVAGATFRVLERLCSRTHHVCRQEAIMQYRSGFSIRTVSFAIAACATVAAIAPSGAFARSPHKSHAATSRAAPAPDAQNSRSYRSGNTNAFGAMQSGPSSSGSSASYGYGVGDNSHGCSACVN
jgi:hypothetical protein